MIFRSVRGHLDISWSQNLYLIPHNFAMTTTYEMFVNSHGFTAWSMIHWYRHRTNGDVVLYWSATYREWTASSASKSHTRHGALMARLMGPTWGPIWGRQDPGGPHVGPMNFAIWVDMNMDLPKIDLVWKCLIHVDIFDWAVWYYILLLMAEIEILIILRLYIHRQWCRLIWRIEKEVWSRLYSTE